MEDKDNKDIEPGDLILLSDVVSKLIVLHSSISESRVNINSLLSNLNEKFGSYEIRSDEVESVLTESMAYLSDFEEQFDTMDVQITPLISMLKKLDSDSGGIRERQAKKAPFMDFYKFDPLSGSCVRNFQPVGTPMLIYKCFYNSMGGYRVGTIEKLAPFAAFCQKHGVKLSPKYGVNAIDLCDNGKLKVIEIPKTSYLQIQTECMILKGIFGDMTQGVACTITRTGKALNTKYVVSNVHLRKLSVKEVARIKKYGLYDIIKNCSPAKDEKGLKAQLGL